LRSKHNGLLDFDGLDVFAKHVESPCLAALLRDELERPVVRAAWVGAASVLNTQ
jgi:hypothetical protein